MRPYLAIIKDSFRAAWASRVLYMLLGAITLLLLILAPLHVREALDMKIEIQDIDDPSMISSRLIDRKDDVNRPGAKRIWESLSEDVRERVTKGSEESASGDEVSDDENADSDDQAISGRGGRRGRGGRERGDARERGGQMNLVGEINDLIKDPSFYHAEDWEGRMDAEATGLVEKGVDTLSDEQAARLNRILIGRELGIGAGAQSAVGLYYANWHWNTFSQSHQQFASMVTSFLPWVFDKFVLSLGLLIAILVTANIIPETFEPGSLNLLLSKPVNRGGLFLAKFFGGCIFITLCATLLFSGLWLWMGLGMRIWDRSIMISIPLYIIVFMIYFSVSAFVGLLFRSVIMSVVATGAFWALCFVVGSGYLFFNNRMENSELVDVVSTPAGICQSNSFHMVSKWKDSDTAWDFKTDADLSDEDHIQMGTILYMAELPPLPSRLGPIYDAGSKKLIAGRMLFGDPSSMSRQDLMIGEADEEFKSFGRFKSDSIGLYASKYGPLLLTRNGDFFRLNVEELMKKEKASEEAKAGSEESEGEPKSGSEAESKTERSTVKAADAFQKIGPDAPVYLDSNGSADFNYSNEEIAIFQRGEVTVFGLGSDESGEYKFLRSIKVETGVKKSMSCKLAYQGNTIVLALGNGEIITLDAKTLSEKNGYLPETKYVATEVRGSHDGRWFAFCYRNEHLWLLDTENEGQMEKANVRGQGSISAVNFNAENQMLVGDRTDRVTIYDLPDLSIAESLSPSGNVIDQTFRYGLRPLYKIFPKPGEFYKVVSHLSDTSDTKRNPNVDLKRQEASTDPWSPLISGVAFMCGMLVLSCLVFWRKDY